MALSPLGKDVLNVALDVASRVLVVNATRPGEEMEIVDVVVVRHDDNGHTSQVVRSLGLSYDESEALYPFDTSVSTTKLIEVLLRASFRRRMVEIYLVASPTTAPRHGWEVGIRGMQDPLAAGEVQITEAPGFVAYLTPYN